VFDVVAAFADEAGLDVTAAVAVVPALDVVGGADDDFELSDPHAAAIVLSATPSTTTMVFPVLGTCSPFSTETRLPRDPPINKHGFRAK
jgi:hypothetical protein